VLAHEVRLLRKPFPASALNALLCEVLGAAAPKT